MSDKRKGDSSSFDTNWKHRDESSYTHWKKGKLENQVQLAFRNHWTLFSELIKKESKYNGGKRVLEVGCGRGSLSCYFSDAGYDCTLLDSSKTVLEVAKNIFKKNNLKGNFIVGDANDIKLPSRTFDIIFSIGLLEHFENIENPLREQIRLLDKGGVWFGYIVPEYNNNIQVEYEWINDILKGYQNKKDDYSIKKEDIYRSDYGSERYIPVLDKLGLGKIQSSGVYSLPMISHSKDFPFSLMPKESELVLTEYFEKKLEEKRTLTGTHPWLCDEGYGNAFLIWGVK